jgi:ankyrin repeat protein
MSFDASARDDVGLTLLMAAAPYGNQRLLTVLLALPDIKINAQGDSGRTALMHDVVKDHDNIVKLLLQQK